MFVEEEIAFHSDGHTLTGILKQPSATGSFPVVIFLQGSEYTSPIKSQFLMRISNHLLSQNIACLIFNKRGVGTSTGSKNSTFKDRAIDALAAMQYVKTRKDIDVTKIGLFGHSQGGWIAQLAASLTDEIDFIINSAGPAETVVEQILTDRSNHLRIDGLAEAKIERKLKTLRILLNTIVRLKSLKFHRLSYFIDYDPKPAIEKIACPALILFGELDPLVPPNNNIPIFERIIEHSGKQNFIIKTFEKANHSFYVAKTGSLKEYSQLSKEFVPGYLDTLTDWIHDL